LGGVIGGLVSTLLLMGGIQNFSTAVICSFIALSLAIIYSLNVKRKFYKAIIFIFLILTVPLLTFSSSIDKKMTEIGHPNLVETKDTPYGRIAITSSGNQISVFENDALSYETESTYAEEFVHLSFLQHEKPKTVLVLGGGYEGTIHELNKYNLKKIDYVEFNKDLIKLLHKHLPPFSYKDFLNIIIDDPRGYLKNTSNYDAIIIGMPEPTSGQTNRFYTKEFFELCAKHLNEDGILSFKLRSSENLWTPPLTIRNASIYTALKSVFRSIVVLPGVTNIFISSNTPLSNDENFLADRLITRKLVTKLITPQYVKYIYTNDRKIEIENILSKSIAPVNSDLRPVCYQYAAAIWLSKFFPEINSINFPFFSFTPKTNPFIFSALLVLIMMIFLFVRFLIKIRRIMMIFIAGFLGMVFETILILHYQVTSGILFQDIGILLTAFMAGLVIGTTAINRLANFQNERLKVNRWIGILLFLGFGFCSIIFTYILDKINLGLLSISAFLIITGFFVSGIFAYASFFKVNEQNLVVSPLYSADLLGGCLGSLAASLLFIPLAGLQITEIFLGITSFISLILV
jgi:spermidine synthase